MQLLAKIKEIFQTHQIKVNIGIYSSRELQHISKLSFRALIINELNKYIPNIFFKLIIANPPAEDYFTGIPISNIYINTPLFKPLKALLGKKLVIPRTVIKNNIDVLFLFDPSDYLNIPIPQFIILGEDYHFSPADVNVLQKTTAIILSSPLQQKNIIEKANVVAEKCIVIEGVKSLPDVAATYTEALLFKANFTGGREYFICNDFSLTKENIILLLKAFSLFKKMQQSNWKLMMLNNSKNSTNTFDPLKTYKYKDDVIVLHDISEYQTALHAAYAAVSFFTSDGFPTAIADALTCSIPVIAPAVVQNNLPGTEILAYEQGNFQALGDAMMLLYKNEAKRQQLAKNAAVIIQQFSPHEAIKEFAERLLHA